MLMAKNKHNASVGSSVERTDERIKETQEVFTPPHLVETIIDTIPIDKMQDKSTTFMDNSCGCGNFLVGLYKRFTNVHNHSHEEAINKLYGVDLMEDNVRETCANLGVSFPHPHFVVADGLRYHYRFDSSHPYDDESLATLDEFFQ